MYAKIKQIDWDTITIDNGERYKAQEGERSKMVMWTAGDSVDITGGGSDVTVRNATRFNQIKARRW